ncbi:hypothetical protein BDN71DRAFT_1491903 [Pleurotus eryngii]|uniref:Uncharacterized protein n=1 Tax=Pleurotus eryngii TaxID=5323 RepID=A0A9P6ABL7_PLEER|nr:hypothetical protein BDN71DRAFT_1491903 [Pleurotus eryngii]
MAISNTYNNSHIGINNVQSVDNSKHVGTINKMSDMFNSQCHNSGYTSPSARNVGGDANYSPQNGNSNYFGTHPLELKGQQAANGMPYGFPSSGMSGSPPSGTPFGFTPNGSWSPQPPQTSPQASPQASPPNQGFHAPQPSTMPSAEPAAAPPPLAQRSVSNPSGGKQSAPTHAQGESGPFPSKKPRFSIHNPFRRSRT